MESGSHGSTSLWGAMAERANDGVGLALEALHISNFALGQKEGRENERVLYYYPEHTEDSLQTRNTGLASALVTFTCAPPPPPRGPALTPAPRAPGGSSRPTSRARRS